MKVSNHQTKENNDAMKVSNHQTKKNDAMKENIRRTTDDKRMMRGNVDRRLVLMFRRPTDDRTFAQWDAESQVKFAQRVHQDGRNTSLLFQTFCV